MWWLIGAGVGAAVLWFARKRLLEVGETRENEARARRLRKEYPYG